MNPYGAIAIIAAVEAERNGTNPRKAWQKYADVFFPAGSGGKSSSAEKVCPRSTFLWLCLSGYVAGIKKTLFDSSRIKENGEYARKAIDILKTRPELGGNPSELWLLVNPALDHQSQMDVVCALFESGLLTIGS
jgi:hypothetical protein